MPVLDLASTEGRIPVEIVVSPAAELLLVLAATGFEDLETFDVGRETIEKLLAEEDDRLAELRTWLLTPNAKSPVHLIDMLPAVGLDADTTQLVEHLRGVDPDVLVAHLDDPKGKGGPDVTGRSPDELRDDVVELVAGWAELAGDLVAAGLPAMERDAEARRRRTEGVTADELVEDATNGVKLTRHPGLERVVLFPSHVFRPWVLLTEHEGTRLICYPVADEFLEHEEAAPPARLVKLFKALGDEGRLKLLRRVAAGPMNLGEAAELLGVAKSTAHHHLAILRQAGLILIDPDDGTYTLRQQLVPEAADLLDRYLDPSGQRSAGG